jgi:flagellar hook protein FlgE
MSFYISLSGLKGAQNDLTTISNNIANANTIGFKKSEAQFSDLFSAYPTRSTELTTGYGTRLTGVVQQFSQGTLEATDRTLDLAIAGEGFFMVRGTDPRDELSYTRSGSFTVASDGRVVDGTGAALQLLPVDADGAVTSTALADGYDFVLPNSDPNDAANAVVNVSIGNDGLVSVTYADGTGDNLGSIGLATFTSQEHLRPIGSGHWQSTADSGTPVVNSATNGPLGSINSGSLERANVDITEELVALIAAQRNFQANAKAIETASNMAQTIFNIN